MENVVPKKDHVRFAQYSSSSQGSVTAFFIDLGHSRTIIIQASKARIVKVHWDKQVVARSELPGGLESGRGVLGR